MAANEDHELFDEGPTCQMRARIRHDPETVELLAAISFANGIDGKEMRGSGVVGLIYMTRETPIS